MANSGATAEAVVRQYLTLINEHKFLDILPLASPTATWWNSGLKEQNPVAGDKTFEERIRGILQYPEATKHLVVDIVDLIADKGGEKVVLEILSKSPGVSSDIIMVFYVKDGKIESVREYLDFYPIMKYFKEVQEQQAAKQS